MAVTEAIPAQADTVERVPAHTKPHYWIAVRGKDIWNRWARGDFTDAMWEARLEDIQKQSFLPDHIRDRQIAAWQEFRHIQVESLSQQEREEILDDIYKHCGHDLEDLPSPEKEVNFSCVKWDAASHHPKVTEHQSAFDFSEYVFPGDVDFRFGSFDGLVFLDKARFHGNADFTGILLTEDSNMHFQFSHFYGNAYFMNSRFIGSVIFNATYFLGLASGFWKASFNDVSFVKTQFMSENTQFIDVVFHEDANFNLSLFEAEAVFSHAHFKRLASFKGAEFKKAPDFRGVKMDGIFNFIKTKWPKVSREEDAGELMLSYSQLKRQMESLKLYDKELFFHGKELEAKQHSPEESKLERRLYTLYGLTSDYGQSIKQPVKILFKIFFACWVIYGLYFAAFLPDMVDAATRALYAAMHYSIPFIPTDMEIHRNMLDIHGICTNAANQTFGGKACILGFNIIRTIHSLLSLVAIFLIGLGLRNRLRLR